MSHLVILDNEAVQALGDPTHAKHRRVLSHIQVTVIRKRRAVAIRTVVPTSVRVEAGWDRTAATSAVLNRLRIDDVVLDDHHANLAVQIRARTDVSTVDAHLGAVISATPDQRITVITSDPRDIRAVADGRDVIVVTI